MKRLSIFATLVLAMVMSSCSYDDSGINNRLDELDNRLEKLEGTTLPSIDEQIESINASIADLKVVDTELHNLIDTLEADDAGHSLLIALLQTKASDLESKITTLEKYVDSEITATEDWATATFATLEQYAEVQSEISALKALIEQNKSNITEAYTTAIAEAITTSEGSMKEWVNEQLAGYYTIAETDAKLELLQQSIDTLSESLAEEIKTLSGSIDTMKAELTEAYEAAITEAIETNNGVINAKIAEEVKTINSRIDEEVASINARIDALEGRIKDLEEALDKIKALNIEFDIENGEACMAGSSIEFGYTIVGGDEDTEVESFGDGGWRADVTPTDATSGRIRVTAPKDGGNGKVIVLATSGAGASTMKSIRFDEGVIADILDSYEVDWEACTLEVKLRTNLDYTVRIPADAQSWLSVADTRAALREDTLTFTIAENPEDEPARSATVELVNELGYNLQSFEIAQKMHSVSNPIIFEDEIVKMVCVEKFDINEDGEISYKEASLVECIDSYFFEDNNELVNSFNELQYFINLKTINPYAFSECFNMQSITIPNSVAQIGHYAFYDCYNITKFIIPDSVTSIGNYAFMYNRLSNVSIPDSVVVIGEGAFSYCGELISVNLPKQLHHLAKYTFSDCESLSSVVMPEYITSIGDWAFNNCYKLESITIPESILSIGAEAFNNCKSLMTVYCRPTIPPMFGAHLFEGCPKDFVIYVPNKSLEAYQQATQNSIYADNVSGYYYYMASLAVSAPVIVKNGFWYDIQFQAKTDANAVDMKVGAQLWNNYEFEKYWDPNDWSQIQAFFMFRKPVGEETLAAAKTAEGATISFTGFDKEDYVFFFEALNEENTATQFAVRVTPDMFK
ncbi:MAG: leucine-rich repeat protein [Alistipes sp.]|nr:leucine-rich repeat protein [Alistipes sp.]